MPIERKKRGGRAPGSQGRVTTERLRVVRGLLEQCWANSKIMDALSERWNCARRTIQHYIEIVDRDLREDYNASLPQERERRRAVLEDLYQAARKDKKWGAAARVQELLIKIGGLDVQRVELTGAGGTPVQVETMGKIDLTSFSDEEYAAFGTMLTKAKTKKE